MSTPLPDFRDLALLANAAVDGNGAQRGVANNTEGKLVDLFGQFPGGGHDQDSDRLALNRVLHKMLYGRQNKGRCFAGAGLRQAEQIAPLKDRRNGLLLNRGRLGEAALLNCLGDVIVEMEIVKNSFMLLQSKTSVGTQRDS